MNIYDLTVSLDPSTPVYPGDPSVAVKPAGRLATDGWNDHILTTGNHAGTHIDAPAHVLANGKTLDRFPLNHFVGRGRYVDARRGLNAKALKTADLAPGDIVLFDTGTSDRFHDASYYKDYPVLSLEMVELLVQAQVKMVGLDTGSADNQDGFPVHKALLQAEILIIENLTNLEPLRDREFDVYALPLKLALDGAPARVIAVAK